MAPQQMISCPCGKTNLTKLLDKPRKDCSDTVPVCGKTCDKKLKCGMPGMFKIRCDSIIYLSCKSL